MPCLRRGSPRTHADRSGHLSGRHGRLWAYAARRRGALALYVDGGARIEQREAWTLEAGDVLIVPAGEPHRRLDARRPRMWRLGFCVPCLGADSSRALLELFERVRDGASPLVRIPADRQEFLATPFGELSSVPDGAPELAPVRSSLLTRS